MGRYVLTVLLTMGVVAFVMAASGSSFAGVVKPTGTVYSTYSSTAAAIDTTPTTFLTLSLPAGSFLVTAKTTVTYNSGNDASGGVVCQLLVDGTTTIDLSEIPVPNPTVSFPNFNTVSLQGPLTLTAPAQVTLNCYYADNVTGFIGFRSLAATQVGNLVTQ